MASDQVLNLTDSDFEATIAEGVTLVDFWAPWCGPCRMLAPVIDKVAARVDGKAKVAKVNTDEANASAVKFGISSIPSILIFKDGELQDTLMGAAQREDDLVAKLEALV
jgi:thioredoxin 1